MPMNDKIRMRSEMYRFIEEFGLIISDHLATSSFATDVTRGNWIALQLRLVGLTTNRFLDRTEVWRGPSTIAYLMGTVWALCPRKPREFRQLHS